MSMNSILGVFAKSPIKPLQEHICKVHQCAEHLVPFFKAVYAQDWNKAANVRAELSQLEKSADKLKREVRTNLPKGLFMPVDRTDMLGLITQQDKIANTAKDISGRILGRKLVIPEQIQQEFMEYLQRCIEASGFAAKAIAELDELLETGFQGVELQIIDKLISELDTVEDSTDMMQITLRHSLHEIEQELNPVDVIFLYNVIEWVGDLADLAERVGDRLELMLARS
ncbi:TIGR00153 family protein [Psychrobium sp. 1_MG-2023]|uniref:TIGR00153 family protein n=1 Tax=Psychrobium sp. 1_MG-2023 TaxID=3062624 RepID=UPI000C329AD9|nr:TIGR00153 family protein [Psychrobium sp. 1_MG-2023]MDP2562238.1 TIGR00153 family protein [Psychrobium sp. 1_MG-2023]PKF57490.1 TIGR00153 family protein [Alteromonadales bacterium alter-6D02]